MIQRIVDVWNWAMGIETISSSNLPIHTCMNIRPLIRDAWNSTEADLHDQQVSKEEVEYLCTSTTLTSLNLSENNLWNDSAELLSQNTNLKHLDLSLTGISEKGAELLSKNTSLESLKLYWCSQVRHDGVVPLLKNTTLKSLSLSHNTLCSTPEFQTTTIKSLDLSWNMMFGSLKYLSKNPNITHLDLSHCYLREDDNLSVFSKTPLLRTLILTGNRCRPDIKQLLETANPNLTVIV